MHPNRDPSRVYGQTYDCYHQDPSQSLEPSRRSSAQQYPQNGWDNKMSFQQMNHTHGYEDPTSSEGNLGHMNGRRYVRPSNRINHQSFGHHNNEYGDGIERYGNPPPTLHDSVAGIHNQRGVASNDKGRSQYRDGGNENQRESVDDRPGSHEIRNPTKIPGLNARLNGTEESTKSAAPETGENKSRQGTPVTAETVTHLNDLKAKVIASMARSRIESSSTPSRETAASDKRQTAAARPVSKGTSEAESTVAKSSSERKDAVTDLDGLLAEGKAAAEAGKKAPVVQNGSAESSSGTADPRKQARRLPDSSGLSEETKRRPESAVKNDTEEKQTLETVTLSSDDSSGGSELGEIREDEDEPPKKAAPKSPESVRREEQRSKPVSKHAEDMARKRADTGTRQAPVSNHAENVTRKRPDTGSGEAPLSKHAEDVARKRAGPGSSQTPVRKTEPDPSASAGRELRSLSSSKPKKYYEQRPTHVDARDNRVHAHPDEREHLRNGRQRLEYAGQGDGDKMVSSHTTPRSTVMTTVNKERSPRKGHEAPKDVPIYYDDEVPYESKSRPPKVYREMKPVQYADDDTRILEIATHQTKQADLDDWLEMTGYHDQAYRQDALRRHREMVYLDMKRAELAREAQLAQERRADVNRAQSVLGSSQPEPGSSNSAPSRNTRSASVFAMPPPPMPRKEGHLERNLTESSLIKRPESSHVINRHNPDADLSREVYMKSPPPVPREYNNFKRRYRQEAGEESGPAEKLVRVDKFTRSIPYNDGDEYDDDGDDGDDDNDDDRHHHHQHHHRPHRISLRSTQTQHPVKEDYSSNRRVLREYIEPVEEMDVDQLRRPTSSRKASSNPQLGRSPRLGSSSPLSRRISVGEEKALREAEYDWGDTSSGPLMRSDANGNEPTFRPRGQNGYGGRSHFSARGGHRDSYAQPGSWDDEAEIGSQPRYDNHHHQKFPPNERGRGRGRGGSFTARGGRWNNNGPIFGSRYGRQDTVSDLGLDKGDSRFFIIKSYNYENVLMAQEENIWMTQERNADIFSEAFQNCRNVIFIFSVNKSMAFQGYARMETAPGTAPVPAWAQDLLWKSSGPFRIRWITIAETRFGHVGHLKNAYNENQPCLVARDGQEVEQKCAVGLCHLIDEEADRAK
ncbi:MAG: hypothetical protein M1837_004244 [Sclerophora amabilis]|nr:MAG: hypothetical protein M1837_004244 [Sclerophora amabilis]